MNLDYLNINSLRNYPIKDDLSRISDDGLFTIPNSLITDISLCGSQLGDNPLLYISAIAVSSSSITIEISVSNFGVFGTFQTNLPFSDYNIDVTMAANMLFPYASGLITFGSSDDLAGLPYGNFTFSATNTTLLMRTYNPVVPGLSWLSFNDTQGNSVTYTGNVILQGNSNIQFRSNSNIVYMDAGEGLGLNKTCTTPVQPVMTINGVGPDNNGNFTLINGNCVGIEEAQYGLVISNPCGQPCLGSAAINALTTQVNGLEQSIISIKNFADDLQNVITQATNLMSIPCSCN